MKKNPKLAPASRSRKCACLCARGVRALCRCVQMSARVLLHQQPRHVRDLGRDSRVRMHRTQCWLPAHACVWGMDAWRADVLVDALAAQRAQGVCRSALYRREVNGPGTAKEPVGPVQSLVNVVIILTSVNLS